MRGDLLMLSRIFTRFYALWADGDARQPSESYLYFTNQRGDHIWRLPAKMKGDFAKPEIVN
jgi:hypothetical protein